MEEFKNGYEFDFLIETALLTHGLRSISNEELLSVWPWNDPCLAWVDKGHLKIGTMKEFLSFRDRASEAIRIDCEHFESALENGISGALTASGTMAAAAKYGISMAVTGGMGGIGDIKDEKLCADLPALEQIPVTLISTSPKDVIDIEKTIDWLKEHGVTVLGRYRDVCTGFMAVGEEVKLSGVYDGRKPEEKLLLLYEIDEKERLSDKTIIDEARKAGKEAEARGEYYHPAANGKIDELSDGRSSILQLNSLIANGKWAEEITGKR